MSRISSLLPGGKVPFDVGEDLAVRNCIGCSRHELRPPALQCAPIDILTPALGAGSSSYSFFLVADLYSVFFYRSVGSTTELWLSNPCPPPFNSSKAPKDVESFLSFYLCNLIMSVLSQPVIKGQA
jgi:hypothetical protein